MRLSSFVLAGSLVANVVLAVVGLRSSHVRSEPSKVAAESNSDGGSAYLADTVNPAGRLAVSGTSGGAGRLWDKVYSEDIQQLADRLRLAGLPEREIRSIASTLVSARNNARRDALMGPLRALPYWRVYGPSIVDHELQLELNRQMEPDLKVLRQLSQTNEALREDTQRLGQIVRRFGNLSPEKLEQLLRIDRDYEELRYGILTSGGRDQMSAQEKLRLIEEEHGRDIRAALTAEEYAEHQFRIGPTANILRARLTLFEPTEEEFRALHGLHEDVRSRFSVGPDDAETGRARHEAMEAMLPQIEAALGPERFADYQQATMESSQRVNNLLVRVGLPLRTGGQIEDMRKDITQRAEAVRIDASLTPAERAASLGTLEQEARSRVSATLGGDRNLAAYEDIKGWIRELRPKL